jgi:hypothetical protein
VTPTSVSIQVLKHTADGSLTLISGDRLCSSARAGATNDWGSQSPTPPPGEKVKFYTQLWGDITIVDANKAVINGEITIIARK